MASKQKRVEATKKRDKRSKIMLAVLGVVLVAVGIFEIPSMLAVMNKKAPPGTKYDPGPSSVVPGSLPNVAATVATGSTSSTGSAGSASTGQLVNTDVPPATAEGQLVTFEVFDTKNPFRPQVTSSPDVSTGSSAATPTASRPPTSTTPTSTTPTSTTPTSTTPTPSTTPGTAVPSTGGTSAPTTTTPVVPPAPTVTIAVNGVNSSVSTNGAFPTGSPVFRLVSYQRGSAEIGIVGGSYAAGGATLSLRVGHPVTLQNTTDGKRYRLELIRTP